MRAEKHFVVVPTLLRLVLGALAVLGTFTTTSADAAHVRRPLSIAEARHLPLGTVVTLEGTVSTPSGAFESSFYDVGFGLQDRTAGIYVSLQTDLDLLPQQHVRVTGVLADSYGLLILLPAEPEDVESCGRGPKLESKRLATVAVGEATEGLLVTVRGTISQAPASDLPYGYKFFVNDGSGEVQIFVNLQTGIDVGSLSVGQKVSVTGFSSQFEDHYEIDPRMPSDIAIVRR